MRKYTIPASTVSVPGTFSYDPTQPTYWTEAFSHYLYRTFALLRSLGFEYIQEEDSEFTAFVSSLSTFESNFDAWIDSAVAAQEEGSSVPAVPSFPALPVVGGVQGALVSLVAQIAIKMIMRYIEKRFDAGSEMSEMSELFQQAFLDPTNSSSTLVSKLGDEYNGLYKAIRGESGKSIVGEMAFVTQHVKGIKNMLEIVPDGGSSILKEALLDDINESLLEDFLTSFVCEVDASGSGRFSFTHGAVLEE